MSDVCRPSRPTAAPFPDEQELLARLRAGDEAAFETLVRRYGGPLLAAARRLLNHEEDAQDALQEALLSAFRAIATFAGEARLSTWLHRIVVNAALMKLRGRMRKETQSLDALLPRFLEDGHQAEPAVEWGRPAQAALEQQEARAFVRQAIEQLPEPYRIVLKLRDIEEFDTQETAALLGIGPSVVKVRLHRARQALRTLLDRHFRGEPA